MSPAGPSGPGFLRMTWDGDFPFRSTWDKLFRGDWRHKLVMTPWKCATAVTHVHGRQRTSR